MTTEEPSSGPRSASSGPGCLLSMVLLVIVVIIGVVVGTMLNGGDDPDAEKSVTVAAGTIDGVPWRMDAVRDLEGEICAFFFQGGEQITGGCDTTPQDATVGQTTVVFGKAPPGSGSVRVRLDSGEVVSIRPVDADGVAGRFYVRSVRGDVDAVGLA